MLPGPAPGAMDGELTPAYGLLPVVAALAACAVLGVYAGPLTTLLHAAARTVVTP